MSVASPRVLLHEGTDCGCVYNGRHLLILDEKSDRAERLIAIRMKPRPDQARLGMTRLGVLRDEYNATVEGHPPRFVQTLLGYEANAAYFEWAARADLWAQHAAPESTGSESS